MTLAQFYVWKLNCTQVGKYKLKFSLQQWRLTVPSNKERFCHTGWNPLRCGDWNLSWESACQSITAALLELEGKLFLEIMQSFYLES